MKRAKKTGKQLSLDLQTASKEPIDSTDKSTSLVFSIEKRREQKKSEEAREHIDELLKLVTHLK